jgi:DNA-binding transcriptional regulator YiaG
MSNYRKLWRDANGQIPIDENGVSHEIHHIDGNHSNNTLSNLKCVSIIEHFQIHLSQGDFAAANRILTKINKIKELREQCGITPKELAKYMAENSKGLWSDESKKRAIDTKREKKVGYCDDKKIQSAAGKKGGPKGGAVVSALHKERGTGVYSREHQQKAGRMGGHIVGKMHKGKAKPIVTCPHCGKEGGGQALMNRWHFDNCKGSSNKDIKKTKEELSKIKSENMKRVWEQRNSGELPKRKTGPRGPYRKKINTEEDLLS